MPRDYETPEDYAGIDYEDRDERDAHDDRDADREEAAVRRWEARREMPYEDDEPETDADYYGWLRREEYGDQDNPDVGVAA